jgi:thioester reductase-like protein
VAVFVTGGTGFLGRQVVAGLLRGGEEVVLLVRGRDDADARAKASAALASANAPAGDGSRPRWRVVRGSLAEPDLGLMPADRERILAECDRILHCAATVRFDLPWAEAEATNVGGTRAVLALARERQRRGGLARYDHVGTAFVAGRRTDLVGEEELDGRLGHRNTYERSKFEAEKLVRDARGEVPACIFRPSIVVGDSEQGRTSSFQMIYWPLRMYVSGLWRTCPGRPDASIDMVPVDFVRDALLHLRTRPETLGRCYHVAAGAEGAITLAQVTDEAKAVFPGCKPLRFVDPAPWMRYVHPMLKHLTFGAPRRIVRRGEFYVPYFTANPRFDNTGLRAQLAGSGIDVPSVASYLRRLLQYCLDTDWGRRPLPS